MANAYTTRAKLAKPSVADRNWNVPLNANADRLDALSPLGGLCVSSAEVPSASLNVQIAPGAFRKIDGTIATFAGTSLTAVSPGQTTSFYLTSAGVLTASTSGYPTTAHVRLATVVTGTSTITTVTDDRVTLSVAGTDANPYLPVTGGTLNDGASIAVGATTGSKIATASVQKLGFWGATPVIRPGPYTQIYTASARTLSAYTPNVQTTAFTGVASGQSGTPYAQAADLNALRLAYENLRQLTENLTQVVNALVDDLQAVGLLG